MRTLILTLFLVLSHVDYKQQQQAALLEILYDGVSLRRTQTASFIQLPVGSVGPVGAGDTLRTDETGRALVTLSEGATIYLLPRTEVVLNTVRDVNVRAGQAVFDVDAPFIITGGSVRAEGEGQFLATPLHLLFADGDAAFMAAGQLVALMPGQGLRGESVVDLVGTLNPSKIDGQLDGCAGQVVTEEGIRLRARLGPSLNYAQIGAVEDGDPVRLMGITEGGGWYRVQFRSGFGWMQRLAIEALERECADIPTLPDTAFDIPNRVLNIADREVELLEPYYATPSDDGWFYQFP